jgi:hypothetical protein
MMLSSCERLPDHFPPPEQHPPPHEIASLPLNWMFVDMADPSAPPHFVKDLTEHPHDGWIFTGQSPTIKILTTLTKDLKFRADFTLWDVAFRQTGPVELQFRINQFELAKVRYDSPGPKIFEHAVPPQDLVAGQESTLSITIDKPWISPNDKHVYGFILQRIGLVRQ